MMKFGKSQFEKLIADGVENERKLRALNCGGRPILTAGAFVAEAVAHARCDHKKLDEIEAALVDPDLQAARSFVRHVVDAYTGGGAGYYSRPITRLTHAPGWSEETAAAAQAVHATGQELLALGARQAARRHPEKFGTIENFDSYNSQIKELEATRARLNAKAMECWGPQDVLMGDVRRDSSVFIAWKLSEGIVSVAPLQDAAERLVNWLLEVEANA